jgi:hypothetical protein
VEKPRVPKIVAFVFYALGLLEKRGKSTHDEIFRAKVVILRQSFSRKENENRMISRIIAKIIP